MAHHLKTTGLVSVWAPIRYPGENDNFSLFLGGETQPGCRKSGGKSQNLRNEDVYELMQKYLANYPQLAVRVDSAEELVSLLNDNITVEATPAKPSAPSAPRMSFSLLDFLSATILGISKTWLISVVWFGLSRLYEV